MSEWWTYRLSDFLLFSSQTYYRLFELYNAAIWPAHAVAVVLAIGVGILLRRRPSAGTGRLVAAILGAFWLWIAIAFHLRRYATINWAAVYFGWVFVLEALLIWTGVVRGRLTFDPRADRIARIGVGVFLFALFVQPLIGPLLGRSWRQVEIFGVAPDPTAVGTLGLLLAVSGRVRWELMAVPLGWCAVSGATLWALGVTDKWVMPVAGLAAGTLGIWKAANRRRGISRRIP